MKFKRYWRVWVGLVISGVLLWLAFRGVDWPSLGRALMAISWTSCGIAALFFLTNLIVRAVRWRVLLASVRKLSLLDVFAYSQIGCLSNILLPLRMGEFVRAVLVGQRYGISKSAVLATVAVERVLDLLNLLVFALVLPLVMEMPEAVRQSVLLTGIVATLAVITLLGMSWQERRIERFLGQASSFIPRPLRGRLINPIIIFTRGLRVLQSGGRMLSSVVCSLTAWVLVLLEILFIFESLSLALPWYAGVFLIVVWNLGIAVPSSPGSIGVAHFLIVLALSVFAVDQARALSVALITHGLSFALNIVLGLAFLWRENISFSRLSKVSASV